MHFFAYPVRLFITSWLVIGLGLANPCVCSCVSSQPDKSTCQNTETKQYSACGCQHSTAIKCGMECCDHSQQPQQNQRSTANDGKGQVDISRVLLDQQQACLRILNKIGR